jgi:peptidoglycan/LPS O-acetylase OafA/YrhL
MSFVLFISNEVVRIAWFGAANVMIARLGLSETVQWGLWAAGILAAFVFAFAFNALVDQPLQTWIKDRLSRRRRAPAERQAVSLES